MTDLACWRCHDGYVIRIHGSEHWLDGEELSSLIRHLLHCQSGAEESLGQEYEELVISALARAKPSNLLQRLGLVKPAEPLRRI